MNHEGTKISKLTKALKWRNSALVPKEKKCLRVLRVRRFVVETTI